MLFNYGQIPGTPLSDSILTKNEKDTVRRRAAAAKKAQQDEIRNKFKGIEYVRQLEGCYNEYEQILKDLQKAKTNKAKLTSAERTDLSIARSQIEILSARKEVIKAKVDLNLRRLRFVLPELKSIELSDPDGDNPFDKFIQMMTEATKNNVNS